MSGLHGLSPSARRELARGFAASGVSTEEASRTLVFLGRELAKIWPDIVAGPHRHVGTPWRPWRCDLCHAWPWDPRHKEAARLRQEALKEVLDDKGFTPPQREVFDAQVERDRSDRMKDLEP